MPKSDFVVALTQLAAERGLPQESVLSAIEEAIASAYRRDSVAAGQNITVKLDPGSGDVTVNVLKTVVDVVADDRTEVALRDARKIAPDAEVGGIVITESMPHEPGRIAAQTAKQVVMQRLRDAERDIVFKQYEDKAGEVFLVTLQKIDPRHIVVDLGRSEAIMPHIEQVPSERYRSNTKMRVLLKSVERSPSKGLELIVSRADKLLLRRLFEMEVPEIFSGAVEIDAIAREPGSRSKVAVSARQEGVDPVGSCVGLRGVRIQNIVNELHGEKIDVVEWSREAPVFIANALSPAQVLRVELNMDYGSAMAIVPERQLSLAIGREGQNARLAAHLTGWKVDIKSDVEYQADIEARARHAAEAHAAAVAAEAAAIARAKAASLGAFAFENDDAERAAEPIAAELAPAADAPVSEPAAAEVAEIAQIEADAQPAAELEPAVVSADAVAAEPVAESADSGKTQDEILEEMLAAEAAEIAAVERAAAELAAAELKLQEAKAEAQAPPAAEAPLSDPAAAAPAAEVEPTAEQTTSLRDLPDDIWTVRRARARRPAPGDEDAPGRIRFAEDIAGLRGGVTASRRRRRDAPPGGGDNRGPARRRKSNNRRRR